MGKELLGEVGERISAFMKNRHSEDKGDLEEEEQKEQGLINPITNPFQNEELFKGKCGICMLPCSK